MHNLIKLHLTGHGIHSDSELICGASGQWLMLSKLLRPKAQKLESSGLGIRKVGHKIFFYRIVRSIAFKSSYKVS